MSSRPGSSGAGTAGPHRSRNAAASRRALLESAQELFGQLGFERTTVREIGERAGVDAALIARYFGSKADLYIAAVAAERMGNQPLAAYQGLGEMAESLVARVDRHGPGPILQALVRSDTSEAIGEAARARLVSRLVDPLAVTLEDQRVDRAQLRAEVAISALIGVVLGRSLEWFGELSSASVDQVVELLVEAFGSTAEGGPGAGP